MIVPPETRRSTGACWWQAVTRMNNERARILIVGHDTGLQEDCGAVLAILKPTKTPTFGQFCYADCNKAQADDSSFPRRRVRDQEIRPGGVLMKSRRIPLALGAFTMLWTLVAPVQAGDQTFQTNIGAAFQQSSPPCRANEFPPFESLVPIPNVIDPFAQQMVFFSCFVDARKNGNGVKKVKGVFETDLIVLDNLTGETDRFPVGSGKFKTNSDGQALFDFEFPTEIFADGFESGDVSAWSYTRTDFTNKKKVDNAGLQCGKSASRQN
jgi:hypothetical protein